MKRVEVFGALRYRDYRLYWSGMVVSVSGLQMALLTKGWLVWKLTGSEVILGSLGLAEAIPAAIFTLFGGAVADKVDLRRLLILLQGVYALTLLLLAFLTAMELVQVWHVFVAAAVMGMTEAFDNPGRQALFPHLVERRDLMKAVSLNSTVWPGTRIFGPAVAGVLIDQIASRTGAPFMGAATAFFLAALSFALFGVFLSIIRVPHIERAGGINVVKDIGEGLKFVWGQRIFAFLIAMTFMSSFFVGSHVALLPVFATDVFSGDGTTLGALYAFGGFGSLGGALVAASLTSVRRRGWLIFGGALMQTTCLMVFASSTSYPFALLMLPLAGIGFSLFTVSSQSTIQFLVPDEFRGRVMAVWGMTYSTVMPLGRVQMGAVAGLSRLHLPGVLGRFAGAPTAVIANGAVMLAFVFLGAASNPRVRNLRPDGLDSLGTTS